MTVDRMSSLIHEGVEPENKVEQVFVYWYNKRQAGALHIEIITALEELGVWDDAKLSPDMLLAALNAIILQDAESRSIELNIKTGKTGVH